MKKLLLFILTAAVSLQADWIHRVYNDTDSVITLKTINGTGKSTYYMLGPRAGWNINFYSACITGMVAKVPDKFKDAMGHQTNLEFADAISFPINSNRCSWKKVRISFNDKAVNGRRFRITEESYSSNNDFSAYKYAPRARPKYEEDLNNG